MACDIINAVGIGSDNNRNLSQIGLLEIEQGRISLLNRAIPSGSAELDIADCTAPTSRPGRTAIGRKRPDARDIGEYSRLEIARTSRKVGSGS
jgi:hypothetical protein